jgi:hypothetical protein
LTSGTCPFFGDEFDGALFREDADVVADVGEVPVRGEREFLGAPHLRRFDIELQQFSTQRMLEDRQQHLFGTEIPLGFLRHGAASSTPRVNVEAARSRRGGHDPVDPLQQLFGSHRER